MDHRPPAPADAVKADTTGEKAALTAKKLVLLTLTALVSINIWTGSPLFAVWVGSKVQGSFGSPKMEAVGAVIAVLGVLLFASALALSWLNERYDRLVGRPPPTRRAPPWMESARGERKAQIRRELGVSPVEKVVVASVVAAVLALEIWFFFFAGSSLPNS